MGERIAFLLLLSGLRVVAPPPPPPVSLSDETVALAPSAADVAPPTAQGDGVIGELALPVQAAIPRRPRIPAGTTLADARNAVRALPAAQDADFIQNDRSLGFPEGCDGLKCPARRTIGRPEPADRASGGPRAAAVAWRSA